MKAVVYKAHGGPENIALATLDDPVPPPGDVLVRVRAVALNGFDPMILAGIPGLRTPMAACGRRASACWSIPTSSAAA